MTRFFITGDKHRVFGSIYDFCKNNNTSKNDVMIILGDSGINYFGNKIDTEFKQTLKTIPITFLLVRGNHEMLPSIDAGYTELTISDNEDYSGTFLYQKEFPNILYMQDGYEYKFRIGEKSYRTLVLGGAYSVDKEYRIRMYSIGNIQYQWFENEQMTNELMDDIYEEIKDNDNKHYDIIFSHTCPYDYIPEDLKLPFIDEKTVDKKTEEFLQDIYDIIDFNDWYCGHWHADRDCDKVHFMYRNMIELK